MACLSLLDLSMEKVEDSSEYPYSTCYIAMYIAVILFTTFCTNWGFVWQKSSARAH
jgi:hypothetical protein